MGTSTSPFGVGKRESHDATDFYACFRPPEVSTDDEVVDFTPDPPLICGAPTRSGGSSARPPSSTVRASS